MKPLKLARDKSFFKNQNTIQPQVTDVVRVQFLTNWSGERDCFTFRQISFTDGENCKVCPVKVVLKNCVVVGNEKDLERLSDKNAYTDGSGQNDILLESEDPHSTRKFSEIEFHFAPSTSLVLMVLVNSCDSLDNSWTGVGQFKILPNSSSSFRAVDIIIARKWPGHNYHRRTQYVPLDSSVHNALKPLPVNAKFPFPRAFLYEFQLLSTCGDPFYVGLNGIELVDHRGKIIDLTLDNISAQPQSVNILNERVFENGSGDCKSLKTSIINENQVFNQVSNNVDELDCRTIDKLIDNTNEETSTAEHSWLAPIIPGKINRIFIVFDRLQPISKVRVWNYGKTPARGVREYNILVDGALLCNGELLSAQKSASLPMEIDLKSAMLRQNQSELAFSPQATQMQINKSHSRRARWGSRHKKGGEKGKEMERPTTSCMQRK